ncbi:MAG: hypothetical protein JJ855_09800 [Rhodospirillales bacterium]|nr:hypothetical protein [Rhodospirillales bacterium]
MKQKALKLVMAPAVAALAILALDAQDTAAASRVSGQYATSKSKLSKVGDLNPKLSRLCRRGQFKQRKVLRLSIGYVGKDGYGITGIAKPGWNLYDPTGAGDPDYTYHFYNQGYSNCRVYEARTPRQNR